MPRDDASARHADARAWTVLRLAFAFVLLWFGAAELHDPGAWAVFVPDVVRRWSDPLMALHAASLLAAGAFLVVGLFQRAVAAFGTIVLLAVLGSLLLDGAVDSVFVRDVGLVGGGAALALASSASRAWSLDRWLARRQRASRPVAAATLGALVGIVAAGLISTAAPAMDATGSSFQELGGVEAGAAGLTDSAAETLVASPVGEPASGAVTSNGAADEKLASDGRPGAGDGAR